MTVLSREDLRAALTAAAPIVEGVAEEALQPNGIDLSLERIARLTAPGALGLDAREPAGREELAPDPGGWWTLSPGVYVIGYAERVNLPNDVMALGRPRSSLLRSGVTVYTAVWDAGYSGRGEGSLHVANEHGWRVQKGARVVQLVFFRLARPAAEGYRGRYQGEGR